MYKTADMSRRRFPLVIALVLSLRVALAYGQTPGNASIPRTADGKPDLSGVWQAMNTAAWDIQDHSAQKGVPAGLGVVVDGEIPY